MKPESVVVLDIGKTNKKAAVYSGDFEVLAEDRISLGPADWNGLEIERTDELLAWFRTRLRDFACHFDLKGICVSAHGATFALLNGDDALALPVLSYTSTVGADLQDEFYSEFGAREELYRATGTPDLGFVNMAKMLYFIRTRLPDHWAASRRGLFYPQFFGHALTGVKALEPTYVGNHSYLWDYARGDWSELGSCIGAQRLFGRHMRYPWMTLGEVREDWARDCELRSRCLVATGIHDSNANLFPYLVHELPNFILASTGTWCVLMRPSESATLTDAQLEAGVFFNRSAYGQPVLTGLLPAGMEYETFAGFAPFKDEEEETALAQTVTQSDIFVIPGSLPDVPVFPGAVPGLVAGGARFTLDDLRAGRAADAIRAAGQRYFAALNLALAIATKRALAHLDAPNGTRVYIDGGFAENKIYCRLMATLCPEFDWVLTRTKEGTSFGAALCGWIAADIDETGVPEDYRHRYSIDTSSIAKFQLSGLQRYEQEFYRRLTPVSP